LEIERRMVHDAELALWLAEARAALDAGEDARAAKAVVWGLSLAPEAFRSVADRIVARGDPTALTLLAGPVPPDLEAAARRALELGAIERRFGPGFEALRAERAGVTLAAGRAVLAGIDATYVVEPDHAEMTAAAEQRLADLWLSPAVRAAYPLGVRTPGTDVLAEAEHAVDAGLPEPIAVAEVVEAALGALDPYTRPVWPAGAAAWEEHHAGSFTGVGVELEDGLDGVFVVALSEGGPAFEANVHVGDRVLAVDNTPVALASDAVQRLRGAAGSRVTLDTDRGTFALERREIRVPTVTGWRRGPDDRWIVVEDGIALVRVSAMRPHTDEDVDMLLEGLTPEVVVFDLRGNAGGDLMAAVNIADRFVADGVLGNLVGRTVAPPKAGPDGELPWNVAVPGHALEGTPVVVLVDGRTASAAELLAGTLRERAGAVLVGERTFGKALSQALAADATLGVRWQVTESVWTFPSRDQVEAPGGVHVGLVPDVELVLSTAERFQVEALRAERESRRRHADGTPMPYRSPGVRADLPRLSADPQLDKALRIASYRQASQSEPER
jgi:carboxyl-terminal processing protease